MTVHLTKFNMMDHLNSEEDCRLALQAAYEEDPGDGSLIEKGPRKPRSFSCADEAAPP